MFMFQASWQKGYRVKEHAKEKGRKEECKSATTIIIDFN
jgi:hypothetical protein